MRRTKHTHPPPRQIYVPCSDRLNNIREACATQLTDASVLPFVLSKLKVENAVGRDASKAMTNFSCQIATEVTSYLRSIQWDTESYFGLDNHALPDLLTDFFYCHLLETAMFSSLSILRHASKVSSAAGNDNSSWHLFAGSAFRVAMDAVATDFFNLMAQLSIAKSLASQDAWKFSLLSSARAWHYRWGIRTREDANDLIPVLYIHITDPFIAELAITIQKQDDYTSSEYVILQVEGGWRLTSAFALALGGVALDLVEDMGDVV